MSVNPSLIIPPCDQFTDKDGGITAEFVAKLQGLDAKNSQGELSIERFLIKSEEAFFDKVKADKRTTATSLRSQRDSYFDSSAPQSSFYLGGPGCEYRSRVAYGSRLRFRSSSVVC